MLTWLEGWFAQNCDGDWEHENRISLSTSDNPGWIVEIDLRNTSLEVLQIPYNLREILEDDWIGIKVSEKRFSGVGSIFKLVDILKEFRKITETIPPHLA